MLYYLLAVVDCLRSRGASTRPFTCPYEIPKGVGGLDPDLLGPSGTDNSKASKEFFAEYKAALAHVPCGTTVLKVFTEDQLPGKNYTVAVIFIYENSVDDIKKWLK